MKRVWSPQTASEAYISTVKSCDMHQTSGEAELVSAMAAGRKAKFIVETWSKGDDILISIGLAVASQHTGGKHVCIVPDEQSRFEYIEAMQKAGRRTEVIVGEPENAADRLSGIDFLIVDMKLKESASILKLAKLSSGGAVAVCRNAYTNFKWQHVFNRENLRRLVRSAFLPVGKGLDVAYVAGNCRRLGSGQRRWIKHVDRHTGEEHITLFNESYVSKRCQNLDSGKDQSRWIRHVDRQSGEEHFILSKYARRQLHEEHLVGK